MKSTPVFCILLALTTMTTTSLAATETPLKLNNDKSVIHGLVDGSAKTDALAFYVPAGTLDSTKNLANCKFKEDDLSPNGPGKFMKLTVSESPGKYSASIPMTGIRGKCEYVLDTLYLNFDNGKIYENISLLTKAKVDSMNKDLTEAGLEPMNVPPFKGLQKLFCEFSTTESVGLCHTTEGFLPEINYEMTNTPADYLLDVRDTTSD